ncbi:methylmalonyl Co-A mutase-associated GTPase MeaB [Stappia stellulata]|uniref:methylmalonyl Co-A mutase-associated GTPase MeaB n=1 Tax=Stappia stellulata TaxID=71235 RepID=UPI0004047E39|nr:methylmalonyl Co-A mutase-associated GTPase MeaB [Stappia stellulata]
MTRVPDSLSQLREGGKAALARAISAVETHADSDDLLRFLDVATRSGRAQVLGLTGPPGVGKSTLTNALIRAYRARGETVGVLAVDPSSQVTGGALLGDRTRLSTDPGDPGIFVRSMAARDRLGGLSDHAIAAVVLMRAVMDRVIVESVGIGQSESDVAHAVDTLVLCIQPGSGDSLQFMKAGVMELPDLVAVTKADMGAMARRAQADVAGALSLARPADSARLPDVLTVSATSGEGLEALVGACDTFGAAARSSGRGDARRAVQERHWVDDAILRRFGRIGHSVCDVAAAVSGADGPFSAIAALDRSLRVRLGLIAPG